MGWARNPRPLATAVEDRRPAAVAARGLPAVRATAPEPTAPVRDLRGRNPRRLRYPAGDLLVVSGIPGSGKSTLLARTVRLRDSAGGPVRLLDSQHARERWERLLPGLPYPLYRPVVRLAHFLGLRRALAAGGSLVLHDCGRLPWVRRWLARAAHREGRALHLVLLDVPAEVALEGQLSRGRQVSAHAFARHRVAVDRLLAGLGRGKPVEGCATAVLLDRRAAGAVEEIVFDAGAAGGGTGGVPAPPVTPRETAARVPGIRTRRGWTA
ncbi:AAA family ATPase [Streptomyces sp. TP-A0874]|uniref:AAA family ATPase n=1 Tax=Streptomyces sp. TP-A0874 TaxID=549819 RepID=UPI000852B968|nr:AAA family ATPase [Streptomyces sp. TP-A0874]